MIVSVSLFLPYSYNSLRRHKYMDIVYTAGYHSFTRADVLSAKLSVN